jgi:protein-S-isoprenylcysteine O-methyltransferase Ste14
MNGLCSENSPAKHQRVVTNISSNSFEIRQRAASFVDSNFHGSPFRFSIVSAPKPFLVARAITYATLFIGFILIYLPGRILSWSGVLQPQAIGFIQIAGMILAGIGAALALWCIFVFVFFGQGTPAPFDPPRRLVILGPYRFVRNPMYIGAELGLVGVALFYKSWWVAIYSALFFVTILLFVIGYEEPTLRHTFGAEYDAYCRQVNRWLPKRSTRA